MKKQKSLRLQAKELEISPAYLSMILSGQRKCPEKLRGALSLFTNVQKTKLNGAWKAWTLPTELLPHSRTILDTNSECRQGKCHFSSDYGQFFHIDEQNGSYHSLEFPAYSVQFIAVAWQHF